MIVDKTGRKLKVGQILDVNLMGMIQGKLVAIKEAPIALPGGQGIPPHLVISVTITPFIRQDGVVMDAYILAEPDPNDPLVKESKESESRSGRIIHSVS